MLDFLNFIEVIWNPLSLKLSPSFNNSDSSDPQMLQLFHVLLRSMRFQLALLIPEYLRDVLMAVDLKH
jgi:hypothetical protein